MFASQSELPAAGEWRSIITLAVEESVIPVLAVETANDFGQLTVGVFEARVASDRHDRVEHDQVRAQCPVARLRQLRTVRYWNSITSADSTDEAAHTK